MLLSCENNTLINLIRIQLAFGAGSVKAVKIFEKLRQQNVLEYQFDFATLIGHIGCKDAERIISIDLKDVYKIVDDCKNNNINIVSICDEIYPERLRNINDRPIVLYIKGNFPDFDNEPVVSVVGPRKISDFGKKAAFSLSKRLAKSGMIIVSGGAIGADTLAHKGALAALGKTVAVLGCGICYDYLPENRNLRETIARNGCLVSEHPPYVAATKYCFPVRNRLISALSLGTVVIEASIKSGSLITARLANEQGRDVFVIPGNPSEENYKGSNALLRDGAIPILSARDVFNQYINLFPDKIDVNKAYRDDMIKKDEKTQKKLNLGLSKAAEMVYNNLNSQKFSADDLINLGLSDDDLIAALTELEIEQIIHALPGGIYEINK